MRQLIVLTLLLLPLVALPAQAQSRYTVYLPVLAQAELRNLSPPVDHNDLHVRNARIQRPAEEYWNMVGEVLNPTAAPLFSVEITARFFDARGQLLAVADGYATLSRLAPGQRSPFQLFVSSPPMTATAYTLAVTGRSASSSLAYRDAVVLSTQTRNNFGIEVFGQVRNPGLLELRGLEVVATFYDLAGQVVDVESGYTSPVNVPAGATATYALPTFDQDLSYVRMEVQAQGYLPP